ncbi:hypothetical protein O0L34_g2912 [Tuta absoluta]|nr:hypothetical protein O0L34_g2912 [Tuta absoluta]
MNPKTPTLLDDPENVDEDEKNDFSRQTSVKNFINWYQDEDVSQKSLKHISEDQTDLNKLLRGNEDSDSDSTGPLKKMKKLKTNFTKRLGSLRSRKTDKQENDNVSLQSNSSDTSRISLTDLKHEFKKFKRLKKPKFRKTFTNAEDEGIGMASILARSVIHVHTSLACIAEKESEHSPCSTMRRTSESEPTVNISDDEHKLNKNDECSITESKAIIPEIHASLKNVDEPDITTRERKLSESCPASPMAERSENYLKLPKETGYFGSVSLSGDSSEAYTSSDEDGEISSSDQNVDFDKSVETTSSVVQSVLNKNVDPAFIAHIERKLSLLEGTLPELKESKSHAVFENVSELQSNTNLETSKSSPCFRQNNDCNEATSESPIILDREDAKLSIESSHKKNDHKHSLMHTAMETILIDKVKALLPPSAEILDTDDENIDAEHHDTKVELNVKSPSLFHTAMETILLEKAQVVIPSVSQLVTPDGTSTKCVDVNVSEIPEHVENIKDDMVQAAIETSPIDEVQTLIPSNSESVSYGDSIDSSTPEKLYEIHNDGDLFIATKEALVDKTSSFELAPWKNQFKNSVASNVSKTSQVNQKHTSSLLHSAMETILMDKVKTLTTVSEQILEVNLTKNIVHEPVNSVVADNTNKQKVANSNLRIFVNNIGDRKLNDNDEEKLKDAETSDDRASISDKTENFSDLKAKDDDSVDINIMNAYDIKDNRLVTQDSQHSLDDNQAESPKMSKETSANITVSPRIAQNKPVLQHFHPILSGKPLETIPSLPESSLDHSESLDIDGVDPTLNSQTEYQCKSCDSESNSASVCGNSHAACDVDRNEREKEIIFEKEKESPHHARHDSCGAREPVATSQSTQNSSFTPSTPLGIHRRSSDSDLSVTPKGGSLNASLGNAGSGGGAILRPSMNSSNIEMLEYPFLTMTEYPPGLIVHLGGTVCARSVKLVDAGGESASRAAWWAELRTELRAHARALRCNAVIAYTESAAICEDVCVLSASGTAAVINLDCDFGNELEIATSLVSNGCKNGSEEGIEPEQCALAHVPYSPGAGPYRAELSTCGACRKARVPAVLLATCAKPNQLPAYAKAVTITAVAARLRRAPPAAEPGARDISDQLPFLEYELHKLLLAKLRMQGANALFSLRTQITIGERCVMALASGTAVRVIALPPPTPPRIKASEVDKNALEIQRAVWDSFTANKAANGYDIGGSVDTILPSMALPELESEDAPALDLCADKDACVLELDEAEDVRIQCVLAPCDLCSILPELESEDAPALDLCADKDACVLELDEAEDVRIQCVLAPCDLCSILPELESEDAPALDLCADKDACVLELDEAEDVRIQCVLAPCDLCSILPELESEDAPALDLCADKDACVLELDEAEDVRIQCVLAPCDLCSILPELESEDAPALDLCADKDACVLELDEAEDVRIQCVLAPCDLCSILPELESEDAPALDLCADKDACVLELDEAEDVRIQCVLAPCDLCSILPELESEDAPALDLCADKDACVLELDEAEDVRIQCVLAPCDLCSILPELESEDAPALDLCADKDACVLELDEAEDVRIQCVLAPCDLCSILPELESEDAPALDLCADKDACVLELDEAEDVRIQCVLAPCDLCSILPELESEDAPALDLCADKDACVLELDEAEDVRIQCVLAPCDLCSILPELESEDAPALDLCADKDACVLELDEAEDVRIQCVLAPCDLCSILPELESEDAPALDLCADKDACVLELDEAEDVETARTLAARRTHMPVFTNIMKPAKGAPPQMFAQVWRGRLAVSGSGGASAAAERHVARALDGVAYKLRRLQPCALVQPCFQLELPEDEIQLIVSGSAISLVDPSKPEPIPEPTYNHSNHSSPQQQSYSSHYHHGNNGGNNSDNEDDIFALDEEQLAKTPPPPVENADDKSLIFNGQVPTTVSLTTLGFVSGSRSERRICALRLLFVRETTAVRELGGLSGFLHTFTCEASVLAIVRAYTAALGGNALTSFYITQLMLQDNAHKNQGQCLLSVGGDVVQISY